MRHHKVIDWEQRLQAAFDRVDEQLEAKYGKLFRGTGALLNMGSHHGANTMACSTWGVFRRVASRYGPPQWNRS